MINNDKRIIQIGQLIMHNKFKNPERGRVYSVFGIAPNICTFAGGQKVYKILIFDNDETNYNS